MQRMHQQHGLLIRVCHIFCGTRCAESSLYCVYFLMGTSTVACMSVCVHTHTHRSSHQTWALKADLHCPILLQCVFMCVSVCTSLLPIHRPFCVGVCQRCCLQAGPHCVEPLLLIDTGPLALHVPMAPQLRRTEGWNRSPGPGESLFSLPFLSPGTPAVCVHGAEAERMAAWCKCMCVLCSWGMFKCLHLCVQLVWRWNKVGRPVIIWSQLQGNPTATHCVGMKCIQR